MTDFWTNNPDFAERWGIAIHEAYEKLKMQLIMVDLKL